MIAVYLFVKRFNMNGTKQGNQSSFMSKRISRSENYNIVGISKNLPLKSGVPIV